MPKSQLAGFLILCSLLGSRGLFGADDNAQHALDEKEKETILKVGNELVTRQQALIQALQDMKIPRAPLERLARFLEDNPKATPEQFNKILEKVAETMPGVFSTEQLAKLKKLYLDELGNVKVNPATEFVAAAKAVAGKLPVVPTPDNPPANPNNPNDPKNTASTLSGATITPPGKSADSFPDISKLAKSTEDAKGLKALEDKLAGLQEAFALQQKNGLAGDKGAAGIGGEKGGLAGQLLGLLRKEGEGKEKGKGEDRGPRRPPEHSPPKAADTSSKEEPREKKADPPAKNDRDRDRDRDRGRRGGGQQSGNEKSSGGSDKKDEKDKDKDKKAEPLFADTPAEKKEKPKPAPEEKTPDPTPTDDPLADASNILTGKPKKKISLGQGSAGSTIQAQPASASSDPSPPSNGGNAGGSGPVVGGQGGGGGGGGGLGEVPSVGGGEDMGPPGGGGGGQTYNFIRLTEYTSGSGGGDSGSDLPEPAGGYFDDAPSPQPRRAAGPTAGSEPLRFNAAPEVGRGWVLDLVGHWKKKVCEGPDRGNVGICFKATGPGVAKPGAQGDAVIRAGI